MDQDKDKNDQSIHNVFTKIPLIAIVFPPIGILMLFNHALKKMASRSKDKG